MRRVSSHNAGHTGCRTGVANDGNGDCTGPTDARDFGALLNCRIASAVDLSLEHFTLLRYGQATISISRYDDCDPFPALFQ